MVSEDQRLVQKCLNGEKDAFGVLADKYKNAVCGLAYRMVNNFHDAQDIGQEVFIDAYQHLSTLKYPHRFNSWIYTITVNRCRMWLRKQTRPALTPYPVDSPESQAMLRNQAFRQNREQKILDAILNAMDELPEANRLVTTLYYVNGLTCKEIAEFTGTSINTIMSKLRRGREELREQLTDIPTQTITPRKVLSGFTPDILSRIENLSPTPQTSSAPIGRIAWLPWAATLIIGLLVMGAPAITPLGSHQANLREVDPKPRINPFSGDGTLISIIHAAQASKPVVTPPTPAENALYDAIESSTASESDTRNGGLRYRLVPGDLLTYKVQMEGFDVTFAGNGISHRAEGLHLLLVKELASDGTIQIVNIAQDKLIVRGREEIPAGGIGLMQIRRDGSRINQPNSHLAADEGYRFSENPEDLFFVPFPNQPLKRGETWEKKGAKYTVIGFENVKGYQCVILEREHDRSSLHKVKARIACDTQSGIIVKLDADETYIYRHASKQGEALAYSKAHIVVALTRKDRLTQAELDLEDQALNQIESALSTYRWIELDRLRQELETVRAQYPAIRLMPGVVAMIAEISQSIALGKTDSE